MKKIYALLFLSFLMIESFSQETKIYNGNYEGATTHGQARYEYYENDNYERIFDGSFKYNATTPDYGLNLTITGNYKKNKKHGKWIYKLTSTKQSSSEIKNFTSKLTGEYNKGDLKGIWTFKRTKAFNTVKKDFSKCNFVDNKFNGEFIYRNEAIGVKINGNFNNNGFFDGIWKVEWGKETPFEEIRYYKDGFCYKLIYRNLSNGKIINRFDKSSLIKSVNLSGINKDTTLMIDEKKYKIDLINKEVVDNTIYEDIYNDNYTGIRWIYNALGFWICSEKMKCNFFMSEEIDFVTGYYFYEIEHGTNKIDFVFEKKLTLIND